jgi:hypothetical protein
MNTYEVKGYTSTGIYAEVVEAATPEAALRKGKTLVRKLAASISARPILRWAVSAY